MVTSKPPTRRFNNVPQNDSQRASTRRRAQACMSTAARPRPFHSVDLHNALDHHEDGSMVDVVWLSAMRTDCPSVMPCTFTRRLKLSSSSRGCFFIFEQGSQIISPPATVDFALAQGVPPCRICCHFRASSGHLQQFDGFPMEKPQHVSCPGGNKPPITPPPSAILQIIRACYCYIDEGAVYIQYRRFVDLALLFVQRFDLRIFSHFPRTNFTNPLSPSPPLHIPRSTATMTIKHDDPTSIYASPNVPDIPNNNPTAERDGWHIPETDETGYRIREEPYGTKRGLRVVLMGAGASTVNFLKKAEETMENLDICVYEKNKDVGGTWYENRMLSLAHIARSRQLQV